MLETIREYAAEKLGESGAAEEARRRHLDWFRALAENNTLEARTGKREDCFERLEADHGNLRAAVAHAQVLDDSRAELALVTALWEFWAARGYLNEGRRLLEGALQRSAEQPVRARLGLCLLRAMTGKTFSDVLAELEGIATEAEGTDDRYTQVQTLISIGTARLTVGGTADAEPCFQEAIARSRGDYPGLEGEAVGWLLISALYGPLPADRGIARCKEAHAQARGNRTVQAFALVERAALEAMRGEFETARRLLAEGREVFRELDLNVFGANTAQEGYFVEMLAGNPEGAVAELRAAYDLLAEMGEQGFLSTIAGYLAHACYAVGDLEEADRSAQLSADVAAADDLISQGLWRSAHAKLLARRGEFEAAARSAHEALASTERQDDINTRAERLADLAEVLRLAGRREDAAETLREALSLYEQKGNLVAAERTRALLGTTYRAP